MFFISELLDERYEIGLDRFESALISLRVLESSKENYEKAVENSYQRLLQNMQRETPSELQANHIAIQLYKIV